MAFLLLVNYSQLTSKNSFCTKILSGLSLLKAVTSLYSRLLNDTFTEQSSLEIYLTTSCPLLAPAESTKLSPSDALGDCSVSAGADGTAQRTRRLGSPGRTLPAASQMCKAMLGHRETALTSLLKRNPCSSEGSGEMCLQSQLL